MASREFMLFPYEFASPTKELPTSAAAASSSVTKAVISSHYLTGQLLAVSGCSASIEGLLSGRMPYLKMDCGLV